MNKILSFCLLFIIIANFDLHAQLQISNPPGILYANHDFAAIEPNELPDVGNQADVVLRIQKLGTASNEPVPIGGASIFIEFSDINYWDILSVTKVSFGWTLVSSTIVGNARINEYTNAGLIPNGYVDSFIIRGEVIEESGLDFPPTGFFTANRAWIEANVTPGTWSIAPASLAGYEMEMLTGDDPLPVDLLSFSAKKDNKSIILNWQTSYEKNNKGFEIQRSTNGKDWENLGFIDGAFANNESRILNNYDFIDEQPQKGINFYRLNQLDFDGQNSISSVVSVLMERNEELNIYPNPAKNEINIALSSNTNINVSIIDIKGRIIYNNNHTSKTSIDVSNLNSGLYKIKIDTDNNSYIRSLVVQ